MLNNTLLTCFSELRSINVWRVSLGWLFEITATELGFIIPLFCHAISCKLFPRTVVWSNPKDEIPTTGVFLYQLIEWIIINNKK